MEDQYDFGAIEKKWQGRWERDDVHRATEDPARPKFYLLDMFPYPSGAGLSVGHLRNYVPMDAMGRYRAMNGFSVLHPMGWDAFGQPAENEALKRGINPKQMVPGYAANYRRQLSLAGIAYDWNREINSTDPEFYRWTQWFFLRLYQRGLAYRSEYAANWCPSCKTGLAHDEVKEGRCWRCGSTIERRMLPQWFVKITAYADRLLEDLNTIDWPESTKAMQRERIGRSEGAEVDFPVLSGAESTYGDREAPAITVFTTRPDTLFGATFMVLAPEHPLVPAVTTSDQSEAVKQYAANAGRSTEMERLSTERAKTGIFTGGYARNPVNGEAVPVWIADYVMMGYGTGAIMAVPAHDKRDFEFARKFDLPVRMVYRSADGPQQEEQMTQALPDGGEMVNSGQFDGRSNSPETIRAFIDWLELEGKGKRTVNYRLRDWAISRQRYWGTPIPMIHCDRCGIVPVPEDQLPVLLPDVERYEPTGTGESPLAAIEEFVRTVCPACGGPARRETDTLAGAACSSWYFFRYADPHNDRQFASPEKLQYWLPVDLYAGGDDHAVGHLLYARFWTKFLFDEGLSPVSEFAKKLRHQGMLLIETAGRRPRAGESQDGEADEQIINWIVLKPEEKETVPQDEWVWRWAKMSKSAGNVITPDEISEEFGVDTLRVYEMFVAPFHENVQWTTAGLQGSSRFLHRVWRLYRDVSPRYRADWQEQLATASFDDAGKKVRRKLHQTIRRVGDDIEDLGFNTAIAALMELVNELYAFVQGGGKSGSGESCDLALSESLHTLVLLLAPFAPHLADELWERLGCSGYTYRQKWPQPDAVAAALEEITFVLQINGKFRDRVILPAEMTDDEAKKAILSSERARNLLADQEIRKVIVVPRRLVNIVTD